VALIAAMHKTEEKGIWNTVSIGKPVDTNRFPEWSDFGKNFLSDQINARSETESFMDTDLELGDRITIGTWTIDVNGFRPGLQAHCFDALNEYMCTVGLLGTEKVHDLPTYNQKSEAIKWCERDWESPATNMPVRGASDQEQIEFNFSKGIPARTIIVTMRIDNNYKRVGLFCVMC
jgi:hypothetical protein